MTPEDFKAARLSLNMTQKQFGDALGITANSVARLERGEMAITPARAQHIELMTIKNKNPDAFDEFRQWALALRDAEPLVSFTVATQTALAVTVTNPRPTSRSPFKTWTIDVRPLAYNPFPDAMVFVHWQGFKDLGPETITSAEGFPCGVEGVKMLITDSLTLAKLGEAS